MVINVGWLLAGEDDLVRREIEAVVAAAQGRCVKVIIEACLLTDEEKVNTAHEMPATMAMLDVEP